MEIIFVNHFFHVFDWDQQLAAMKRIIDLSMVGTICVSYQRAQLQTQIVRRTWRQTFLHDLIVGYDHTNIIVRSTSVDIQFIPPDTNRNIPRSGFRGRQMIIASIGYVDIMNVMTMDSLRRTV